MIVKSEKIAAAGWIIPFGLFLLLTTLQAPLNFKKCTIPVIAEYVSFYINSHRGIKTAFLNFHIHITVKNFSKLKVSFL